MEKPAPSDPELLADWLGLQSETAFHALVARYAGLVHATARRTCGDDSMAAEASQLTFITLAQKAKSLTSCASLGGWLHTTAMMQAKNLIRKSQRENRKRQLLQSAMETEPPHVSNNVWKEMQPVLDDALAALSDKDREALLLRFYRSLSVCEIAATLGIANDAAEKRIERATERLRGKLARRGCQAGGSFAAVMLAGFAADAQAAVPGVSLLASKAIAAGATGVGFFPATAAILSTTMKTTSLIPPFVALIFAGAWIGTHRQSIYALDRQSDLLEAAISAQASSATASSATVRMPAVGQSKGKTPFDWIEVADRLAKTNPPGHFNDVDQMLLNQRLGSMSKEELVAALDEIAGLDIPESIMKRMEEMLIFPLSVKFPEFTVMRLTDRFQGAVGTSPFYLSDAFKRWVSQDFEKAAGWMDGQNASGTFDTKSLDGKSWLQEHYNIMKARWCVRSLPKVATVPRDAWTRCLPNSVGMSSCI